MDPRAFKRFRKNKGALFGAVLVILVTSLGLLGPWLAPHDPAAQFDGTDATAKLAEGGIPVGPRIVPGHPLGGDGPLGRDELSRLLHGARVSILVAYLATFLSVFIGVFVGLVSGYFRGPIDTAAMRTVDLVLSMPFLLVAIVLQKTLMQNVSDDWAVYVLCLILGVLSWPGLARITRAKTLEARELEYVEAARALGMSSGRILIRHVLPNIAGPIIALATLRVAGMIVAESGLSFLGLGVRAPTASWGSMLSESESLKIVAPHLLLFPASLIALSVFGFNLFGEGLRDAFDPKD